MALGFTVHQSSVTTFKRSDNAPMALHHASQCPGILICQSNRDARVGAQIIQNRDKSLGPGAVSEQSVKVHVQIEERRESPGPDGVGHFLDLGAEPHNIFPTNSAAHQGKTCCQSLEVGPQDEYLSNLLGRESGDKAPAVRKTANEPLLFKLLQSLTYGSAAHAEHFGQTRFYKATANGYGPRL